ncbi:uncharacterized protein SCHCODRAFT_02490904, partial [Schizophyllum commune H4-8]|uniref:uncharacterized protein n=1 Tax=Schizophyllum commune (strain H4-8 / FGSC 9210) TaxID=578458 RepID=UPI00215F27E1
AKSKTQRACLKNMCASRPPWDRCIVCGRCTGARPQRGPRVNLSTLPRGPTGVLARRSEREVRSFPGSYFIVPDGLSQSDA